MAQITYSNKVAINTNSGVADINKVNASDMNEIKTVVNSNYSEQSNNYTTLYNSIYYQSGDTYTADAIVLGGLVTGSTATVLMSIALPKRLTNISSVTVNNFTCRLRGISGYLNNQSGGVNYATASGYTINATLHDNIITFALVKSSAFTNTTNNTPVSIYFDSISLTFS